MKRKSLIIGLLLCFGSYLLFGQQNDSIPQDLQLTSKDSIVVSSWMAGLGWNIINDSGSRLNDITDFGDRYNAVAFPSRLSLGRYLRSGIGIELIGTYNVYKEGNIIDGRVNPEDKDYFAIDARLSYDLNKLFGQTGFFDPYLGVGLGYSDANDVGFGTYNAIVGFRTWFNDRWALDFNSTAKWAFGDEGSNHVQHGLGVIYQFNMEKELSRKGADKLAMLQELEKEKQRINDSIAAANRAEEEALALAEELARKKAEAEEAARLDAERKYREGILQAIKDMGYVYYNFDSSYLTEDSKTVLDKLAVLMTEYPSLSFEIHAHADSRGPGNYNQWLSERRAERAVNYLQQKGIGSERLTAKGFGEERLTNHCSDGVRCTSEEHRANRRSEFEVIGLDEKGDPPTRP